MNSISSYKWLGYFRTKGEEVKINEPFHGYNQL